MSTTARFPLAPVSQVCQCLHAWHVPAHDRRAPVSAFHYCSHTREGMHQCVVYDSPEPDARLLGIEYVISEEMFKQLPEDEKRFWHSHKAEVESGMLVALGVSGAAGAAAAAAASMVPGVAPHGGLVPSSLEQGPMRALHTTYGKAVHTWHPPSGAVPLGPPTLMMSIASGEAHDAPDVQQTVRALADERKRTYGIDADGKRAERAEYLDLAYQVARGADQWAQKGRAPIFEVAEREVQGLKRK